MLHVNTLTSGYLIFNSLTPDQQTTNQLRNTFLKPLKSSITAGIWMCMLGPTATIWRSQPSILLKSEACIDWWMLYNHTRKVWEIAVQLQGYHDIVLKLDCWIHAYLVRFLLNACDKLFLSLSTRHAHAALVSNEKYFMPLGDSPAKGTISSPWILCVRRQKTNAHCCHV